MKGAGLSRGKSWAVLQHQQRPLIPTHGEFYSYNGPLEWLQIGARGPELYITHWPNVGWRVSLEGSMTLGITMVWLSSGSTLRSWKTSSSFIIRDLGSKSESLPYSCLPVHILLCFLDLQYLLYYNTDYTLFYCLFTSLHFSLDYNLYNKCCDYVCYCCILNVWHTGNHKTIVQINY